MIVYKVALAAVGLWAFAWLLDRAWSAIALMSMMDRGWR